MPTIKDLKKRIKDLGLKTGDLIMEEWYDRLVDVLSNVAYEAAVDVEGYVHRSIIPDKDLMYSLGDAGRRFIAVHTRFVYYTYLISV